MYHQIHNRRFVYYHRICRVVCRIVPWFVRTRVLLMDTEGRFRFISASLGIGWICLGVFLAMMLGRSCDHSLCGQYWWFDCLYWCVEFSLLISSIWWIKLFLVFVKLFELVGADRSFVWHLRRESSPLITQYYQLANDWTLRGVWSGRHGWLKVLLRPDSTRKWEAQHVPDERAYQVTIGRASLGSQCTILSQTDRRAIS